MSENDIGGAYMLSKEQESDIFEIITYSGNAKSLAYESLNAASNYNFEKSEELSEEAQKELNKAHNTQTSLIQDEINGKAVEMSLLMVHAQDHLMSTISEKSLIEKMVELYKEINRGKKQ